MSVAASVIEGPPLEGDGVSCWTRFNSVVDADPDRVAIVSSYQPSGLYGFPCVPLQDEAFQHKLYLRWTYKTLRRASNRLACALELRGVRSGMAQITFLPNGIEVMVARWASMQIGTVDIPINLKNLSNREEVVHMIKTVIRSASSSRVVIIANDDDTARQIDRLGVIGLDSIRVIVNGKPGSSDWIQFANLMSENGDHSVNKALQNRYVNEADDARILFTSGTTSLPKGCRPAKGYLDEFFDTFKKVPGIMKHSSVLCLVVPNNHAMAYFFGMIAQGEGATIVFPDIAFNPATFVQACYLEQVTHTCVVPTMVHTISAVIAAGGPKMKSMENLTLGGTMVTAPILKLCQDLGAKRVINTYKITKNIIIFSGACAEVSDLQHQDDITVGSALPGWSIKICAPGSTNPLPRYVSGEMHFSGRILIPGYIGQKSDNFYEENGKKWFKTGDQAYIDDKDRVFIGGRYKEMLIRGSENISPAAIESRRDESTKIQKLNPQVVGVPDTIAGEVPVAILLGKVDSEIIKEVQDIILRKMGNIYVPDEVIPLEALGVNDYPKTMAGKVKKTELAALVRKYRADKDASDSLINDDQLQATVRKIWAKIHWTQRGSSRLGGTCFRFCA